MSSDTTRKLSPHTISVAEYTELRRQLWTLIAEIKKVAHFVPNAQRASLIQAATEAERKLS